MGTLMSVVEPFHCAVWLLVIEPDVETLPPPAAGVHEGFAPAPPDCRTLPEVPGASATQPVELRNKISPWTEPIRSKTPLAVNEPVGLVPFAYKIPVSAVPLLSCTTRLLIGLVWACRNAVKGSARNTSA